MSMVNSKASRRKSSEPCTPPSSSRQMALEKEPTRRLGRCCERLRDSKISGSSTNRSTRVKMRTLRMTSLQILSRPTPSSGFGFPSRRMAHSPSPTPATDSASATASNSSRSSNSGRFQFSDRGEMIAYPGQPCERYHHRRRHRPPKNNRPRLNEDRAKQGADHSTSSSYRGGVRYARGSDCGGIHVGSQPIHGGLDRVREQTVESNRRQ